MLENKLSFDWVIGFVWGVGTIACSQFYIRHSDEELLLKIAEVIEIPPKIYHTKRIKTFLKVPLSNILPQTLFQLGWTGRFDKARKYPQGNIDELEFIRGYSHTKATKDMKSYRNSSGERSKSDRLRVYGSQDIVFNIDQYFVQELQTTPKKPYLCRHDNQDGYKGECYCVQYQSKKEVPLILKLIKGL